MEPETIPTDHAPRPADRDEPGCDELGPVAVEVRHVAFSEVLERVCAALAVQLIVAPIERYLRGDAPDPLAEIASVE